ncbi:MAG: HAD family hydrolase [Allosphingosinicella sp.]|uniref:HAD family hydrolase n=1 Tax=Allosphingosinicella sp. TaxID=2823234 RepID=UPI003940ABE1
MIGAVIFDMDGTLIDTNDLHAKAWQEAFRKFGVELEFEEVRAQIGKGGDNLIPTLLPAELVERCRQEIEDHRSELFQRDYLPLAVPFPGVRALFERIVADGRKVVLASSAKAAELAYYRNLIGASDLIHAATSKDDVESSKPCPDIFEAALGKVAPLKADEVVVIGDSTWDVKAAVKIGIPVIGVRCGGFPEDELLEAGAAAIYDGPQDLLDRYESWME